MNADIVRSRLLPTGFFAAVIAKFWLIWESEIVDAIDDPHEYILQIIYPANGGLGYGPGTGLIGKMFGDFDIPFRLGIEALYVFAVVLVLRTLFTWPWKGGLSLGLFVFVLFDPAIAELFSHFYSDQIWMIEIMLGFSCIALALRNDFRPNLPLLLAGAFCLGLSVLTRSTFIPLVAGLVVFLGAAVLLTWLKREKKERSAVLTVQIFSTCLLLLVTSFIYCGTCLYNLRNHAYFGISAIDCNEYKSFYFCLQSVGEPTGKPYYPIDENRRKQIALAGPISNWLMGQVEGNTFLKQVSFDQYGTSDIASGWMEFALYGPVLQASNRDLKKCMENFHAIEDEINEASRRGTLTVRPILPLPDSRVAIVAGAFPSALVATIREVAHEPSASELTWNPDRRYVDHDFTTALNRRAIVESPARDAIWRALCPVYACLYTSFAVYLYLAVWIGFLAVVRYEWRGIRFFSLGWLAQQLFVFFFIVWLLWYALFDASGWPVLSRYMILNHVLLPILLSYYAMGAVRLLREEPRL